MGVRPPFFTFVAVRAIAPVAGMPPNSGDAMFATPCAINSIFDLWRPPIIPSETTADRSDSIEPNNAIVTALGKRTFACVHDHAGKWGNEDHEEYRQNVSQ